MQPSAMTRRRPYTSDRYPNSTTVMVETIAWIMTRFKISPQEHEPDGFRVEHGEIEEWKDDHRDATERDDPSAPIHVGQISEQHHRHGRDDRLDHDKVQNQSPAEPELLRAVGDDIGRENVKRDLLTRAQQRRQRDLSPVPLHHLDHRRPRDGAFRLMVPEYRRLDDAGADIQ